MVLWAPRRDAATAVSEVFLRAGEALEGVPAETRQAHPDGTTGFERILPGPDRMYPDTDTPPLPVRDGAVERIRLALPERPWEREDRYRRMGVEASTAQRLAAQPWADLFDRVTQAVARDQLGPLAGRLARAMTKRVPCHRRRGRALPDAAALGAVVQAMLEGRVRHEALDRLLDALAEPGAAAADLLDRFGVRGRGGGAGASGRGRRARRRVAAERVARGGGALGHGTGDAGPARPDRAGRGGAPARGAARSRRRGGRVVSGDRYRGYRGPCLELLKRFGVSVWSEVEVATSRGDFAGLILPRSETSDEQHLVLKLASGYNIGLRYDTVTDLRQTGFREVEYRIPEREFPVDPDRPRVRLFGTGGTIASRLDYRTGAVIPAFTPGELYGSVPELADICNLETEKLFGVFSENMGPDEYLVLAARVGEAIGEGYDGIVIGHGTDTMHHTAAALSFMVQRPPVPVVMVGSQRSSDRPSSDAARNLISATWTAAHGPIAEVMVCMFGPTSDRYNLLHRGTRVRKMHSSYRSTFRTLGDVPLAMVEDGTLTPIKDDWAPRRDDREVTIQAAFDERVTLL